MKEAPTSKTSWEQRTLEDAKRDAENGFDFNSDFSQLRRVPAGFEGEYVVPDCVRTIEPYAFVQIVNLTSVVIPDSVTRIGSFALCPRLKTIRLSESISEIPDTTFMGCMELQEIEIPDNVRRIGNHAFSYCIRLKQLSLSKNVSSIGNKAFSYSALTPRSVVNLDAVSELADDAFENSGRAPYTGKFTVMLHGYNNIHGYGYYAVSPETYQLITDEYDDGNLPAEFVSSFYDEDEAGEKYPELSSHDFLCLDYFNGPSLDEYVISVYDEQENCIWQIDEYVKLDEGRFELDSMNRTPTIIDQLDENAGAVFGVEELLDGHPTFEWQSEGLFDPSKLQLLYSWNHDEDVFVTGFCYDGERIDEKVGGFDVSGFDCDPESFCIQAPQEDDEEEEEFDDEEEFNDEEEE